MRNFIFALDIILLIIGLSGYLLVKIDDYVEKKGKQKKHEDE